MLGYCDCRSVSSAPNYAASAESMIGDCTVSPEWTTDKRLGVIRPDMMDYQIQARGSPQTRPPSQCPAYGRVPARAL